MRCARCAADGAIVDIDMKTAIADYLKTVSEWAESTELATPEEKLALDEPGEEDDLSDEED